MHQQQVGPAAVVDLVVQAGGRVVGHRRPEYTGGRGASVQQRLQLGVLPLPGEVHGDAAALQSLPEPPGVAGVDGHHQRGLDALDQGEQVAGGGVAGGVQAHLLLGHPPLQLLQGQPHVAHLEVVQPVAQAAEVHLYLLVEGLMAGVEVEAAGAGTDAGQVLQVVVAEAEHQLVLPSPHLLGGDEAGAIASVYLPLPAVVAALGLAVDQHVQLGADLGQRGVGQPRRVQQVGVLGHDDQAPSQLPGQAVEDGQPLQVAGAEVGDDEAPGAAHELQGALGHLLLRHRPVVVVAGAGALAQQHQGVAAGGLGQGLHEGQAVAGAAAVEAQVAGVADGHSPHLYQEAGRAWDGMVNGEAAHPEGAQAQLLGR